MATAGQQARKKAQAIAKLRRLIFGAVAAGVNEGLRNTVRLSLTKYMQRLAKGVPANPPPGPLGIRTGNLARTVKVIPAKLTGARVTGGLQAGGGGVSYARIHELGGLAGRAGQSMIGARPYLRPALLETQAAITQGVEKRIDGLIKSLGLA